MASTSRPRDSSHAKRACFVITPFSSPFDDYYRRVWKPAIRKAGYRETRADDLYGPRAILHDIWKGITGAAVVLAELTGRNPNVLYELGLAHAEGKPAVIVTQTLQDVPSDLRFMRVIVYRIGDPYWGAKLKKDISAALREVAAKPKEYVPAAFLGKPAAGEPSSSQEESAEQYVWNPSFQYDVAHSMRKAEMLSGDFTGLLTPFARALAAPKQVIEVTRATPSQIRELASLVRERYGANILWAGKDERYVLEWTQGPSGPTKDDVAKLSTESGMRVAKENGAP